MRPLKLTMQAFGPYAGTETIDFSKLQNRTMFVISGKTGSGKTTIFDGISYAIYGKASGEDRSGTDLRSHFAKEDVPTEVSLQFSLRGKTYYIKRAPQQEKKKERGDGFRLINAQAELYMYDEGGEKQLIAANVRDVDEKIKELMQIDSNQFRQILMIPQGEFRKLLTSDSKEKEVILQRLFHTEIYKRVEDKLKEEATSLKKAVEKQIEERDQLIRKISVLNNEELRSYLEASSVNDTIILPLLEEEIEWMKEKLEVLSKEVNVKEKERELLLKKQHDAETIIKQLQQRDELGEKKSILEGQKELYQEKDKEISLANKASLLSKQEELCQRLKRDLDQYTDDLKKRGQLIDTLKTLLRQKEEAWILERNREDERKAAQELVSRLQQIKDDVKNLDASQQEVGELEKTLNQTKKEKNQKEKDLKKIEETIKNLSEQKQMLEKTDVKLLENERLIEKLNNELDMIGKYEQQESRHQIACTTLERKMGEFHQVELRLKDAKLLLEELEQKWLHGQASIIASQLHDGMSCPVCGSMDHPNPAKSAMGEIPNEEDMKAAKEQISVIEKEKTKAESALYEVQSNVKSTEQALGELLSDIQKQRHDFSKENMEPYKKFISDKLHQLLADQNELKQNQLKLEQLSIELKKSEGNKENYSKSVEELNNKLNALTIAFTEKNTRLTEIKNRIPDDLRSIEAFEKQWKLAVQKQEALTKQLEDARQSYEDTKVKHSNEQSVFSSVQKSAEAKDEELKNEREVFIQQMSSQGFENYGTYDRAKRTEEQIEQLNKQVRNYWEELRSVTDRFLELTNLLKDVKEPDIEGIKEAIKEVGDSISSLNDQYTNLLINKRENEAIRDAIKRINEEMKVLEERYKLVGHLYEISKGQNTYRITFERFVLAAFLDDILREANGRLAKMTSGRYEMIRKTDRSKGNVQSGLELLVFDQYTGQERHVKTLSGGESFKAALSLALGLADVVQQYAGGVSLETMFIDEGFGTLDPESLDQAIEALIDIQSSGRLVGIISHVPELRERIDARLEVISTQTGSVTEFHFLNG